MLEPFHRLIIEEMHEQLSRHEAILMTHRLEDWRRQPRLFHLAVHDADAAALGFGIADFVQHRCQGRVAPGAARQA